MGLATGLLATWALLSTFFSGFAIGLFRYLGSNIDLFCYMGLATKLFFS